MGDRVTSSVASALEAFCRREQAHPERIFLVQPLAGGQVEQLSWGQAGDQARRIASYLRSLDLPERSHIALFSRNCAHWIVADLAIWMAGHVSVPVYPTHGPDAVRELLDHADCRAVFIGKLDDWQSVRSNIRPQVPWIALPLAPEGPGLLPWQTLLEAFEPLDQFPLPAADDVATLIYTSGTSGPEKGVLLSFAAMCHAATNWLRLLVMDERDRLLSYLPLSHIAERQFIETASLLAGATVYFVHSSDTFVADARRARPTLLFSVPRIWSRLQRAVHQRIHSAVLNASLSTPLLGRWVGRRVLSQLGFDRVRYALSGAAPIQDQLILWYQRLGMNLVEMYGLTENCGYSHLGRPKRFRLGRVGLPNPGVECRLAEDGEILVRSKATMLGYYKDSERTAEALDQDGFLHTGDLGDIDQEGLLRVLGRKRELFESTTGRTISPATIERLIASDHLVDQVCVVGSLLPQPIALVQLASHGAALTERPRIEEALSRLLISVNECLGKHERLGCIVVIPGIWAVENGFMTPMLTVRRSMVEAAYRDRFESWSISGRPVVWADSAEA
ncbi:AMP-binding protein [Pseudomonas sp.]|uniref:AMP-binding protein n=1 Tax=Pseudomonas sp. TaxID=306 RepID=UPI00272A24C9|nr:AMP-binding protein [Pseudomonas sp.]